jgi:hypothetical protein
LKQFGCGEVQAPAKRLELVLGREKIAQSEVDDLDVAHLADEDVFNLEIPVNDAVSVTVIQCTGDLSGELAGLLLF